MYRLILSIAIAGCVACRPAFADFVLLNAPPPAVAEVPAPPLTSPIPSYNPVISEQLPPVSPKRPKFATARGFGHQVPLSFAVQQIVPYGIAINYGSGVDPNVAVDWHGGRPWPTVLRAALQPLGLHLTLRHRSITIAD